MHSPPARAYIIPSQQTETRMLDSPLAYADGLHLVVPPRNAMVCIRRVTRGTGLLSFSLPSLTCYNLDLIKQLVLVIGPAFREDYKYL